jgi:fatty acid synthase subunit alpha
MDIPSRSGDCGYKCSSSLNIFTEVLISLQSNPVLAYLQRNGTPQGLVMPLTTGDSPHQRFQPYPLSTLTSLTTPHPLGAITHGLWSSAAARKYVGNVVAR